MIHPDLKQHLEQQCWGLISEISERSDGAERLRIAYDHLLDVLRMKLDLSLEVGRKRPTTYKGVSIE